MTNPIPQFRSDGYLPEGLHKATLSDAIERFGFGSKRRQYLVFRLEKWAELSRLVRARRLFVDGSFVTSKLDPNDIDAVVLLPKDFRELLLGGFRPAVELEYMLLSRQPEEIFGAEDDDDWNEWLHFFEGTRESDGRQKGLVEILL